MKDHNRSKTGIALAATGVFVLLFEIGLHFYGYFHGTDYELNHPVLYVAIMIGFVGFYMLDPKKAEDGSGIISRTVIGVISVIRTGKTGQTVEVQVTKPTTTVSTQIPIPPSVTPTKTDDESGK